MATRYLDVGGQQFQGPDASKSNRRLAEALVEQGMNPGKMTHWSEALGSVLQTGMGALRNDFVNADERDGKAAGNRALAEMLAGGDGAAAMANPYSADQALQIRTSDRNAARSASEVDRRRQLEMQSPEYQLGLELKREQLEASKADRAAKARAQQREEDFYRQFDAPPAPASVPTGSITPPSRLGGPRPTDIGEGAGRFSAIGQPAMPAPMYAGGPQSYDMAEGEAGPGMQVGQPMPPRGAPQHGAPQQGPVTMRQLFDRLSPQDQAIARGMLAAGKKEEFLQHLQSGGGMAGGKAPTEQQSKDALFVRRMMDEERTLDQAIPIDNDGKFTGYDPTTTSNAWFPDGDYDVAQGWLGTLPTRSMNSEGWNRYYDAAQGWISSLLRKDTGAAVTREEWNRYFPTYFPQPGDSPQMVLDKKRRRMEMQQGLMEVAGPLSDRVNRGYTPQQGYPGQKDRLKSKYGLE